MSQLPRQKMMRLVEELLAEEGPLTTEQIARRLAEKDKLYVVMEGEKEMVSTYALERALKNSAGVLKHGHRRWKLSIFSYDHRDSKKEIGFEDN